MGGDIDSELVLVCRHILEGDREIELIVHHSDDKWQIMCGAYDHADETSVELIHAQHLFEDRPAIERIMQNLQRGFLAELKDEVWEVSAHDD